MLHTAKNTVYNHTEAFKRQRQKQMDFYNSTPFYGSPFAKELYTSLKKVANVLQCSICGVIVNVVCYKQDEDKIIHLLSSAFKKSPRIKEDELTGLINVTIINR